MSGPPVSRPCVHCGKKTERRIEVNPPDESTQIMKWVCSNGCYANWSTGQPKPANKQHPDLGIWK